MLKAISVILIVIGLVSLIYRGFTYTSKENVIEMGPVEVTTENKETVPLPRLLGGIALAGGIVLLIVDRKKGSSAVQK